MKIWIALLALCALECGCATGPAISSGDVAGEAVLFISPMGEPFRAAASGPYPSRAWFDQADADYDGRLTRAEVVADARRFFAVLDSSGSGRLSSAGIDRYETEIVPEITRMAVPVMPGLNLPPGMMRQPGGSRPGGGMGGGAAMGGGLAGMTSLGRTPKVLPVGAALYELLPYPEPVASAKKVYGQPITQDLFLLIAGDRFDL